MSVTITARIGLFILALNVLLFASSVRGNENLCLSYAPKQVSLVGTLKMVKHFGPPNYGETPATDARVLIVMLYLDSPINVCPAAGDEFNTKTHRNIRIVQLTLTRAIDPRLVGSHIRAIGTLYEAESAHNYTDVMMDVIRVSQAH